MPNQLIVLTVLVLLPVIPSFLLFKLLPSRAVVNGPLAGLNVALGGAFAGYVCLTVFVATYYAKNLRPQTYRTWSVRGQLQFPAGERPPIRWDLGPPLLQRDASNGFYFQIPVADGADLPDLVLEADGYPVKSVKLSGVARYGGTNYKKNINDSEARIDFEEPIVFEKPPAVQPYAPAVAQTAPAVTGGG
jgi:hypothetical protein